MNAPMSNAERQAFLDARRQGIGGSDVAAILGFSPWKTPLDVYLTKTAPPQPDEMSEPAYWGTVLEDVVAQEYAKRSDCKVQRVRQLLRHPHHPWALANIDRAIVTPSSRARLDSNGRLLGVEGILECKTASAYKASDWGRDGDDEAIPVHYAAQGMWYLAVTGQPWCDFACLIGGQKFVIKRIERDEETIASMVEQCRIFWFDHVLKGVPPPISNGTDAAKLFPLDNGQAIEASTEMLTAYSDAVALRAQIEAAEQTLEQHLDTLKASLGEASSITLHGRKLVSWKCSKDSRKTDWQAVAIACGASKELIAAHTHAQPGSRRFLFAKQ